MREYNTKILANTLLEWTLDSKTTFLKAEDKNDLAQKAGKLGIELPSPDLAVFETVYCEVDKYNRNGVKLPKTVAQKGIKTLIGKQCNWNHLGANQICGYIIDSEIKEDKVYITGILFKSLFKEEFDEVIKLFEDGKLFVSFELWNRKEDGKSIIRDLGNGFRELTEMVAHGCALLLIDKSTGKPIPPACPKAQVQKLLASEKVIQEAEQIIESVFESDERLVYAELATTKEGLEASSLSSEEGGKDTIMAEEIKKEEAVEIEKSSEETSKDIPEIKPKEEETQKAEEVKVVEVEQAKTEEPKVEEIKEETKTEAQKEEPKVEVKSEEIPKTEEVQAEKVETTPEEIKVVVDATPTENKEEASFQCECLKCGKVITTEQHCKDIKCPECQGEMRRKDRPGKGNENASETQEEANVTTTITETKEIVNTNQSGKDEIIQEVKQESITVDDKGQELRKVEVEHKEVVTYTYEQVEEIKANYEVKLKEKDTEIAKIKEELDKQSQEIESIKLEKAAEQKEKETQPEITVGSVLPTADKYKEIQKSIDTRAFGSKK